MILNIFILIFLKEIIAVRKDPRPNPRPNPLGPEPKPWVPKPKPWVSKPQTRPGGCFPPSGGGPISKPRPRPKRSPKDGVSQNTKLYSRPFWTYSGPMDPYPMEVFGPFFPIPPVKCRDPTKPRFPPPPKNRLRDPERPRFPPPPKIRCFFNAVPPDPRLDNPRHWDLGHEFVGDPIIPPVRCDAGLPPPDQYLRKRWLLFLFFSKFRKNIYYSLVKSTLML